MGLAVVGEAVGVAVGDIVNIGIQTTMNISNLI
jgi:hypothetical protein